jgi:hypothetical protein
MKIETDYDINCSLLTYREMLVQLINILIQNRTNLKLINSILQFDYSIPIDTIKRINYLVNELSNEFLPVFKNKVTKQFFIDFSY